MPLASLLTDKKHIIWDWNGTILDDVQHAVDTMNQLLISHQLPTINIKQYKEIFEFPVKNYYDKLGFDYSKKSFENLCHDFVDKFMRHINNCIPFTKIESILKSISKSPQIQSVLSATDQINLEKMIHLYKFTDDFDYVYGINDKFGASKLERGTELIQNSKISIEHTVLIGDTLHDLEVGLELGIDVILLSHGHQTASILESKHKNVISLD